MERADERSNKVGDPAHGCDQASSGGTSPVGLRGRLQQELHASITRGVQADSRTARIQACLEQLTPETEQMLRLVGELIHLGVDVFGFTTQRAMDGANARARAEREQASMGNMAGTFFMGLDPRR